MFLRRGVRGYGIDVLMNQDHEAAAEKIQSEIYRRMTPRQKWDEVEKLRRLAWELKSAGVRAMHPEWSPNQVEQAVREIFLYATT